MPRMVLDTGDARDERGHLGDRPQCGAEPARERALPQGDLDRDELLRRKLGSPAGSARRPQGRAAPRRPRSVPPHDALAADPEPPGDGAIPFLTGGKQPGGHEAALFHGLEIPSCSSWCTHTYNRGQDSAFVTILCETQ